MNFWTFFNVIFNFSDDINELSVGNEIFRVFNSDN